MSTFFRSLLVALAALPAITVLSAPTSLDSPPQSFFTTSCNATCGLDLSHQLVDQPTALDRFNLLNESSNNFVFDFLGNHSVPEGPDGHIILATAGNFPALVAQGVAMGVGFMGPCGLNVPHLHPRASEILVASQGDLVFGTIQENGASFVSGYLKTGSATVFPQGSIHFQQNVNCKPAQFVAAFGSSDPGRLDVAPALFEDLPVDIVNATLQGIGVKEVEAIAAKIPLNIAFGTQKCLDRCGLQRPGQWTPAAIEEAKRQFDAFMKQGAVRAADFKGLSAAV